MSQWIRQIGLSGALLFAAMTSSGVPTPIFCGFERFERLTTNVYEAAAQGAVYFDGEVMFKGSALRPSRDDDRIVVWYRRLSEGEMGELVVTAGFIDPNGQILPRDYPIAVELEDGTYHRVTIRAVENILDETLSLPGFVVFLDGQRIECDAAIAYAAESERFQLGWAMRERFVSATTRAVFPSMGVKMVGMGGGAKITRAGIQGAGGVRNCVLTDESPLEGIEIQEPKLRIGDEYFSEFSAALSALREVESDREHPVLLRLLADFAPEGGVLEIPEDVYLTLDLAGHRLKGAIYVMGALTVIDTLGGGVVEGSEDSDSALMVDGGSAVIRAGQWLMAVYGDGESLQVFAGEFFDESLNAELADGGFYLAERGDDNELLYFAKGSYISKVDYEEMLVSVSAADSAKVTVTFVYGARVWATAQYTAGGDDWSGAVGTPTATGYSFANWLRADGSVWKHDYAVKSDQYVTAAFTNNFYVIRFLDNTNHLYATRSYVYAQTEPIEMPEPPENEGWDLKEWRLLNSSSAWKFDSMVAKDQTLIPFWTYHYDLIELPRAVAGLVADGNLKTGVVAGVGYTLTGNTETEAGTYRATAKLWDNYKWSYDSRDSAIIEWKIYTLEGYAAEQSTNAISGEVIVPENTEVKLSEDGRTVVLEAKGGASAEIQLKEYYDAKIEDGHLKLMMNEKAQPQFADEESDTSPIEVSETEFSVTLQNVYPGLKYRIGTKETLGDADWEYGEWQTVDNESSLKLSVEREVSDVTGFYIIEYGD